MKDNSFKVDENGFTADGYRALDPICKKSMYLGNLISLIVLGAIFAAAYVYSDSLFGNFAEIGEIALILLFLAIVVLSLVEPIITFRRYRYKIDEDKVDIRKGILYITHQMVPLERIHQVDVSRGPINRAFGLANITITTAGGTVTIEYLLDDVAEGIATKLNENLVGMLRERE